jgi:DNA (cytosine-5)-methyltransferase 1
VTVIDLELFAGPGGWDIGARQLGIHLDGLEWDEAACATGTAAGFMRVQADVRLADPFEIISGQVRLLIASPPCQAFSAAGKGAGRAGKDIILEGVRRIRAGDDPELVCKEVDAELDDDRAALVLEPLRWVKALRPETIALEQVPAVLPLWEAMAEVFADWGYSVSFGNLMAEQYDVPQTRKRAILIASRVEAISAPPPVRRKYRKGTEQHEAHKLDSAGLLPWISMREALGWGGTARPSYTVTAGGTDTGGAEPYANGARKGQAAAIEAGEWALRVGNQAHATERTTDEPAATVHFSERINEVSWRMKSNYNGPHNGDVPRERTRRELHEPSVVLTGRPPSWEYMRSNHGHIERPRDPNTGKQIVRDGDQDYYVRRSTDKPAAPITSGVGWGAFDNAEPTGDGKSYVASSSVRITVQEAAILQGFPADYPWQGTKSAQYRQVGDAMPPPLAWHILRAAFALPVRPWPGYPASAGE